MRVFVAVCLPEEIKKNICSFTETSKKYFPEFRWIKKEALHITLKFISHIDEGGLIELQKSVENLVETTLSSELKLAGVGVFPSFGMPRVLWAGVASDRGLLNDAARRLESALPENIEKETCEFMAHVTLARIKRTCRELTGQLKKFCLEHAAHKFGSFYAENISVFESVLRASGAEHKELCSFKLKNRVND